MLEFIKQQLGTDLVQESKVTDETIADTDNGLIVEFAHLFQELSDISEEGTETAERGTLRGVEIPLADDIEVDSIEMNLMTGNVSDIPGDAAKKGTIETESAQMKTFDDFFEEMYSSSTRFERESEENHISRIRRKANEVYQEYVDKCYQEGLFGFGNIDINDPTVPASIAFDFGTACGAESMMVQIPLKYVTEDHRGKRMITRAQRECAMTIVGNQSLMLSIITDFVSRFRQENATFINETPLNQILIMQFIGVPKQDKPNQFAIYVAADTGIPGKPNFDVVYTISKADNKNMVLPTGTSASQDIPMSFTVSPSNLIAGRNQLFTKIECVQMEYEVNRPRRFDDDYYQEAIDFGEEPASDDNNSDNASSEGEGEGASVSDNQENTDDSKKDVDTNDVSDAIVDKVSSDSNEGNDEDGADDEGNTEGDEGASIEDNSDDSSVDDDLENLNDSLEDSSEDMNNEELDEEPSEDEGMSDESIDNMTIDELMQLGNDKLKGMTLKELKDFVSNIKNSSADDAGLPSSENPDDDSADLSDSGDVETEAFILTSKNINSELDINIRNCLGILNDSDISSDQIFSKFRGASKKLNKVSAKASNMSKVYTDDERKTIGDMNKALVALTLELRSSSKDVASIKEKMKAFVNAAAAVGKIVESKKQ